MVEEASENLVRQLLCPPPLRPFILVLILGHGLRGHLEPHDIEQEVVSRCKRLLALLVLAELKDGGRRVRLDDEVKEVGVSRKVCPSLAEYWEC